MPQGWFTPERIDSDTFAVSEYKHWEETHCYLLCGTERAVLIDTGLGVADIKSEVCALTDLPVSVLTTHAHWDHIGGHGRFDRTAVHEEEKEWLSGRFPLSREAVIRALTGRPCDFPDDFSAEDYTIFSGGPDEVFHDGDRIELGGRSLTVIHTPGHSPGHCCFYEESRGYLYSGDLIYRGTLDAFYPTTDPRHFYQSVRRVAALPVSRILPGHHSLFVPVDITRRIEAAFCSINDGFGPTQGSGVFDFGDFKIHI